MNTITVTVAIVETMPEHLRASHRAAGNWGRYPHNGAERIVVPSDEVGDYVADGDDYDHVVCEYSATLDEDGISVHDAENHLLGTGRWNGSIVDCPATLGDDVYEALDAALLAAGAPAPVERTNLDLSPHGCVGDEGETWWECEECGDYAWVPPGQDPPECSCGNGMV